MTELLVSPEADQDLLDIWLYIAVDSLENADLFLDRLYEAVERLVLFPEMGGDRSELAPGLRSFPVQRYVIFYKFKAEQLKVVRVLSAARDMQSIF